MYEEKYHSVNLENLSFLITGGAGFIGSHIVEYLLKYNAGKVRVLDNLSTGYFENIQAFEKNKAFEFVKADICNPDDCLKACKDIDYVFHQAALGSVPRSIKDPLATNQNNITGFLNMLVAAKDSNVKRFVYASSSSVFGDSQNLPKIESEIGNPLSPYAVTKRVNELYAEVFRKIYNIEIIGLRYFNIFGPRQNPQGQYAAAIPLFITALINNEMAYINGDGEQSRDFTFIENAVQANILAQFTNNENALGEVFNIAVGEKISVNKLYSVLKELSGKNNEAVYREERPGDVKNSLADISKASNLLNYKPNVFVDKGLKITFDWFVENYKIK